MRTSIILLRHDITPELYELTKAACATLKAEECILIDNASTVGEIEWGDIRIKNTKNLGYPAGVNQGFKEATGDLIAVANNDIRASSNWLQVAKDIFEEHEKVGSVHFRMIDYDYPMAYGFNTWIEGKERWCTSSFFVIRGKALQEYDENFGFGGYDDYDYWHRFRQNGWKTAYTTKACYQHAHSATQRALSQAERAKRDQKNRTYFKSKHGEYPEVLFARLYPEQMKEDYYLFFQKL